MSTTKVKLEEFKDLFLESIKGTEYQESATEGKKGYAVYDSFLCELQNEHGAQEGVLTYKDASFQLTGYKNTETLLDKIAASLNNKYPGVNVDLRII